MKSMALLGACITLFSGITHAQSTPSTGYFIDAPVSGLYYQTSSGLSGVTNKGKYQYNPNDVVSFFLGSDESSYLLTTLSSQKIITPSLATTQPSRSINITRLLLSLDSTPLNQEEIVLASRLLSDPNFQQKLKSIDLSFLNSSSQDLGIPLVSVKTAVEHLNQSQEYIQKNFTSDDVIYQPLNTRLSNIIIKKKDWSGKLCAYDLRYRKHPKYTPPFGSMSYQITNDSMIQYPSVGDYFNGCYLDLNKQYKEIVIEPIGNFAQQQGLVGCAQDGCTRNDLNGFSIENYSDEGKWKYRTVALSFDPSTQLLMEKVQGLGPTEKIQHNNQTEMLWFTYPEIKGNNISYQGIWQKTQYLSDNTTQQCLFIKQRKIFLTEKENTDCPTDISQYSIDVTDQYPDMWWLESSQGSATLAQMNILVRWYNKGSQPQYTTWEYLPAGESWDQGVLYRYRQEKRIQQDGSEQLETFKISEFKKIAGAA
ncbi:chromosome partitioning protein ParA [Vibrionales bacterium C3R12]|nr:chromosome partitioning protein ParA [Vibrionales bacterium C3R12]